MIVTIDGGIKPKRLGEVAVGTLVTIGAPDGPVAFAVGPGGTKWACQLVDLASGVYYALPENAQRETVYPLPNHFSVTLRNKA